MWLAIASFFSGTWAKVASGLSKVAGWLVAAGVFLLGVLYVVLKIDRNAAARQKAKDDLAAEQRANAGLRAGAEASKERQDVEDSVRGADPDDIARRLRRWERNS